MASEARTSSSTVSAGNIIARQDRLQVWSLAPSFLVIIGVGFLFTFFDIFDINVSFIQTCTQIAPGCTPVNASSFLGLPVLLNLVAYVVGALFLTPFADRFGRRDTLLITLVITGIGSLYTAFSSDMTNFTIARIITGVGIGADLAIVNTYINEVAPRGARAKYTSLIFFMSALGAFFGIWIGLFLTTPATPFPLGLPFAVASASFTGGWRLMYFIGTVLALIGVVLRFQLPESPRWLIFRGRVEEADRIVQNMEERAAKIQPLPEMVNELPVPPQETRAGYAEIFSNPVYLRRTILLLVIWLFAYITVYTISAGMTSVLATLNYPPPEAGLITAMGTFGFLLCAVFAYAFGERLERKYWLPIGAAITLIGGIIVALGGTFSSPTAIPIVSFIGSIILFFGFNVWVPVTYAWSTENFPTRARTTGFGIVDGVGHIGAGVGLLVIAPLLGRLGPLVTMLLIGSFLVVSAIVAQFGIATRNKRLDDVSP